jgi:hypothetical protein
MPNNVESAIKRLNADLYYTSKPLEQKDIDLVNKWLNSCYCYHIAEMADEVFTNKKEMYLYGIKNVEDFRQLANNFTSELVGKELSSYL